MAITRWDPFRDFLSIQEEIAKMFEKAFGTPRSLAKLTAEEGWIPTIDVYEKDKEVIVKAELPGLTAKDVDVSVDEEALTIKGERKFEEEVKEENFYRLERRYGNFQRVIPFPTPIVVDKVKASFKDGILEVRLPKLEEAKPKKVKVKIEE